MTAEVIQPMLAESIPDKSRLASYEGTHIAQIKYDGTRVIAVVGPEEIRLISRSAKTDYAPIYPEICAALAGIRGTCVLDGELAFFPEGGSRCVYVKADSLPETRAGYNAVLMVFDVLSAGQQDYRDYEQSHRTALVERILRYMPSAHVEGVFTFERGFSDLYDGVVANGGEGIILKDRRGKYRHDGVNQNRSRAWLKCKRDETVDCVVMGVQIGRGKTESTFGALILGQYVRGELVEVGRASGMTNAERRILLGLVNHIPEDRMGGLCHDKSVQRAIEPRMVVEVEIMERSPKGRLRHPRYLRLRTDKAVHECTYEGGEE
jgi:bifunctional non-homologous end joining protein LigD